MDHASTRWTLIQRAAAGRDEDREAFARRYAPVIAAYLGARWRGTPLAAEVDDAAQQVFVECFKEGGALGRADPERPGGFGAFLYGVTRNVAAETERTRARRHEREAPVRDSALDRQAADDPSLAQVFDRAWASALMRDAAALQLQRARAAGDAAVQRHRLLALRHGEGLPIRDIARRWDADPDWLHGQYRQARKEFRRALEDVVRDVQGGDHGSVEAECRRLLELFS
jgi:RNA polymerase sigma factor (sigma-70 family)